MDLTDIGVAISTTGQDHRIRFLETSVAAWTALLPVSNVVITVDGDADDIDAVLWRFSGRVPVVICGWGSNDFNGRQGVAVNKNTGIEALMDLGVGHTFLCDDDTRPRNLSALTLHVEHWLPHSLVSWGKSRLVSAGVDTAHWSWPRGVLMYTERNVIEKVGGMDEDFGIGGHEHAEWSRRIHQHGFTPHEFVSPGIYARDKAQGSGRFWVCEDQPRPGEWLGALDRRRKSITTVDASQRDWNKIQDVMEFRDNNLTFVPYRACDNSRSSATLYQTQEEN